MSEESRNPRARDEELRPDLHTACFTEHAQQKLLEAVHNRKAICGWYIGVHQHTIPNTVILAAIFSTRDGLVPGSVNLSR